MVAIGATKGHQPIFGVHDERKKKPEEHAAGAVMAFNSAFDVAAGREIPKNC